MNKLDITKKAVSFVVGVGASRITGEIIKNNSSCETAIQKITTFAGATVLGMMAADASKAYTDTKIDEYAASFADMKKKLNEAPKEESK